MIEAWLTPTSLFVLLNIVIATILLSSAFTNNQNRRRHRSQSSGNPPPPQLARAPSLISRVTSFSFTNHYYPPYPNHGPDDPAQPDSEPADPIARAPSLLARVSSLSFSGLYNATQPDPDPPVVTAQITRAPSLLSRVTSLDFSGFYRPDPEPPLTGNQEQKIDGKTGNEEARESSVGKKKKARAGVAAVARETASFRCDEEVDAKADDFINKFQQQLKLQRLESLLRCRNSAN